jgi:hypothetical protein
MVVSAILMVLWKFSLAAQRNETVTTSPSHSSIDHSVSNQKLRLWPLYIFGLILLAIRTPFAIVHGSIGGEEGTVFLRYARESSPLRAFIAPHQGYYSLVPNLCGLITARILPFDGRSVVKPCL